MKAPYQDQWRNGKLVRKGRRECAQRFADIAERVGPIGTLTDVGGWDGYFSRRFAEDGARCTLIEPRNVPDLPSGVTHRQERVTAATTFDRADVLLALSVLHHMPDWGDVYANLRAACDVLIVETPTAAELDGELSPTLVETGPRIAPLHERVTRDGEVFAEAHGPNKVRRPLVAIVNTLAGKVEDGSGTATDAMAARPDGWWEPLGYEPSAGTLNLRVGRDGRRWVQHLPNEVQAAVTYWPVTVNGVACHARTTRALASIEVVAPVNLRTALNLHNGDKVEVRPR